MKKLVIDIPEEDYNGICNLKNEQLQMLPKEVAETLIRIKNGTPLVQVIDELKAMRNYYTESSNDW